MHPSTYLCTQLHFLESSQSKDHRQTPQVVSAKVHGRTSWYAEHVHNCAGRYPVKLFNCKIHFRINRF
jgi:hypothetical protein